MIRNITPIPVIPIPTPDAPLELRATLSVTPAPIKQTPIAIKEIGFFAWLLLGILSPVDKYKLLMVYPSQLYLGIGYTTDLKKNYA
jgi:hypothetical protein